jgi:hypothetical protein
MTTTVFQTDMKRIYLPCLDDSIWQQAVAKLDEEHTMNRFARHFVAQIDGKDSLATAKQLADAVREVLPPRK